MADIRIKDLTTTASSTASDDFIAVDGTTNGTRKLNAFSPTFGGNATVTGTLTVNGTTASVGAGTGSIISKLNGAAGSYKLSIYQSAGVDRWYAGLAAGAESGSDGGAPYSIVALTDAGAVIDNALLITRAAGGSITTPRPVSISATTASTSTSSGALVVGNGTSGGLGVGGAANIGGALSMYGEDFTIHNVGYGSWVLRNTAGSAVFDIRNGAGSWLTFPNLAGTVEFKTLATTVKVAATTASTSTSSGALVVSGGVGVAKEMYLGGGLLNVAKGGAGATIEINADSGFASKLAMQRAATNRWTLEVDSSDVLTLKSLGTTAALTMTGTTSAEFVGSIKTAAPSGGTAANWKLGTVASVSPTSPNRTIEVDIGGTIYYIHAKTTNN